MWPVMTYISQTLPGVARGPHEHLDQTDGFAFIGPSDFKLYLWDTRSASPTRNNRTAIVVGQSNPTAPSDPSWRRPRLSEYRGSTRLGVQRSQPALCGVGQERTRR